MSSMQRERDPDSAPEEGEVVVVEKMLQVPAELRMDLAVSSCCPFEVLAKEVLVAAIAAAAVDSVAVKLVCAAVVVESVCSSVPDIVEPTRECDLIDYHRPYRQKSMAPWAGVYLRSMNLVAYFARFCVDPGAKSPAWYAPLPVSSCPPRLSLGANYALTRRVHSIATEEQEDCPVMLYLAVLCLEVQNSNLEEPVILYGNYSYCPQA